VPHPIFYFPVASTPEIYTLSLHDALPICRGLAGVPASQSEGADVLSSDRPSVPSAAAAGTAAAARRLRDLQHGSGRGVHALRGLGEPPLCHRVPEHDADGRPSAPGGPSRARRPDRGVRDGLPLVRAGPAAPARRAAIAAPTDLATEGGRICLRRSD